MTNLILEKHQEKKKKEVQTGVKIGVVYQIIELAKYLFAIRTLFVAKARMFNAVCHWG